MKRDEKDESTWTVQERNAQRAYEEKLAEMTRKTTQELQAIRAETTQNRCKQCNRLAKKGHELCKRCEANE